MMLLTETIKNSTSAIIQLRNAQEKKQSNESYEKSIRQLEKEISEINNTIECAIALKENGIINQPLIGENARDEILECIVACGNGINNWELNIETVKLLHAKGDAFQTMIKVEWKEAAQKYAETTAGYLSMIAGLSSDPLRARGLVASITATINENPSKKAINRLINDVAEAKQIIDTFALNPDIEKFLRKVASNRATVLDLTPSILNWLQEKNLTNKLKLKF